MTMKTDDPQAALRPATRCWLVTPCQLPQSYGVPLFQYVASDGQLVETAISPLPREGECCPDLARVMASATYQPSLDLVLNDALESAPQAVIDSVHAHLLHKRPLAPPGHIGPIHRLDPVAGLLLTAGGDIPAVAIATHGGLTGLIALEPRARGTDLQVRWVHPRKFRVDRDAFGAYCAGLTHEDLLAGLESPPLLAVQGVMWLLQQPQRWLPPLVIGAFVLRLLADLEPDHPACVLGGHLLAMLGVGSGQTSARDVADYADALSQLRPLIVLVADKRVQGKEALYEQVVARPSWQNLYESILDAMAQIHRILDSGVTPARDRVAHTIEQVALSSRDPFSKKMVSFRGRVLSGIGELASRAPCGGPDEDDLARRFRQIAQLVGTSGWENTRPYEAGVLVAVMGGW